ncbi:MAG: hypothetical protein ACYS1C_03210 [Planctomycetota bacterium]|jgi:benzoyl-CoA reductase/2-hydroxyglutaryl-CoA dehydratase subunit BcrC/BadD/HgdB
MSENRQLWKELRLDMELHDQLVSCVAESYEKAILSQPGRPRVMVAGCPSVPGNWKIHHTIETDYSEEDAGQLSTRVEALLESVRGVSE